MKEHKRKRRYLFRIWLFGAFFYVSNMKLKPFERSRNSGTNSKKMRQLKTRLLEERGGVCEVCGRPLDLQSCQFHHVVPYSMNGLHSNCNNLMLLCNDCHFSIHKNPLLYSKQIKIHVANHPEILQSGETLESLYQREVKVNKGRRADKEWKFGPIRVTFGE